MFELESALAIVGGLIAAVGLFAGGVSLWLIYKYYHFNRRENSLGLTGTELARKILDDHDLRDIEVKHSGSLLFGNSYSHYFKKVRLRSFIRHQHSLTSIGMGAQKAALAILDKEGDPDMEKRIRMTPLVTFGPFAFIPLLLIGAALDFFILHTGGLISLAFGGIALLFYVFSIVFSVLMLKTERKAQERAYAILSDQYNLPAEELDGLRELFLLYNIQYINDIVLSSLELLYKILEIAIMLKKEAS